MPGAMFTLSIPAEFKHSACTAEEWAAFLYMLPVPGLGAQKSQQ